MGECYCDECCCEEHAGEPRLKIAVDIEGELVALERSLMALEGVVACVGTLARQRKATEELEQAEHEGYVSDSERSRKLETCAEMLRAEALELTRAMLASTTVDDGIPF